MQVCLFLIGGSGQPSLLDVAPLQRIEGLRGLVVHEPISQRVDPRIAPTADAPSSVLQLYFDELATLEAAAACDGPIHHALQAQSTVEHFTQQAMAVRTLAPSTPGGAKHACSGAPISSLTTARRMTSTHGSRITCSITRR